MSRSLPPPFPSDLAPRGLAALALSLLLAGCAVGPDFQSPAAPAVDAYVAPGAAPAADAGQQLAAGADIPAQWWRLFQSEALDALVRQALATSPTLDEARARLRQAAEDLNAETGGRLLPSVDGNLSVARQKVDPSAFGVPVAEQPAPFTLYNASIDVSYTLDVFGANRRALEGLGAQVDYQRHELQAARMSLAANVVTAAIRQADLSERRDVTRELLAAQVRQRDIMRQRLDAGGVSQADLSNQELLVAQTRATLPPLDYQLAQVTHQLATYLGLPPADLRQPPLRLADLALPPDVPTGVPSALTRQRPDVLAAEALWHRASADVGVATANLYPQFTLTASFGSQRTRAGDLSNGVNVWNLGLGLAQPLFHGGELRARQRSAQAAYDAAAAAYRQTVLDGFRQVADALRALQTDGEAYLAQDDAWRRADEAERIAQGRYRAGGISHLSLLDSQRQQLQTRLARAEADAARYADTAALLQALGGGWWNEAGAP
ncbi:efflux transporter outer membrane subunit [Achromobacter denitrificans]|uniref:efflux transporter outer membrane subunit n=1 Tax=Achromobacter TaxID=222 RepID=UPI001468DD29|nr:MULTISPECIES: efflux transporter outer membrane subunit [Achromobacter]MBV2161925.1 efflux transporter outer membrane subunit [Achromobacter denitrificans]MDX3988772.1 efflux transporter outer membrane subunit [Achromobacter sp.]WFC65244.1 efflux transporter outer membrane subunit [Achromobacter denitrificans]CAB3908156.1 putative efflux pump outer membrane protein TtgC [Achromobacter denitrificans]